MTESPSKESNGLVSTDTKITAVFIIVSLVLVAVTTTVTNNQQVHIAVLLGVGVIAPTLINEWRD
jgi:hypothetical protein